MPNARLTFLVMIGLPCLVASVPAHAQPLFPHAESIESTVANADLVFIAKLVKFGEREPVEGRVVHNTTIAIEETLKQRPREDEPYRRLQVYMPRSRSVLADWKKRSCRLLVATDEYAPYATTVIELTPGRMEVMSAEIKLLRDPDDVIKIAKETVRRMPAAVKRIHTFDLQVPRKIVAGTEWEKYYNTGGHLRLSVPVDKKLEKRAQDYVRSEEPHKRGEGARALVYFKSDENLALVRPLLEDPGITYVQPAYEDKGEERVYGARYAAYRTLKSWGVDVEEPVIREEVRKAPKDR